MTECKMIWYEEFDDDNTVWTASSPYYDLNFIIKQRLVDNKIEFCDCSDKELQVEVNRCWDSLEAAQKEILEDCNGILNYLKESGELNNESEC